MLTLFLHATKYIEKQVVHRLQHKLAKQKETREEAKAHKKASREALTSGIINVCGMLEKDMNVQKNKELQAMALKMNQKKTTKAIRTVFYRHISNSN